MVQSLNGKWTSAIATIPRDSDLILLAQKQNKPANIWLMLGMRETPSILNLSLPNSPPVN
jgi:hypothetical protein